MNEMTTEPARDATERLLELAGPRPPVPEMTRARVKRAAKAAWQAKVEATAASRRRQRRTAMLLAAALASAALGLVVWQRLREPAVPVPSAVTAATVEAVWPGAHVSGGAALVPGATIAAGEEVTTSDAGRLALRLESGATARLDAGSRLAFVSSDVLELAAGAVYLDSGGAAQLEVRTALGVARDVGTRFEVRLGDDVLEVRVRDGEVRVETGEAAHVATAGDALAVRADGSVARAAVEPWADDWGWILETSPSFELEGRPLGEFLTWVAGETGWRVVWADPELEAEASAVVVHGSLEGLRPDEAPGLVLPSAGLDYRLEGGVLEILRVAP